MTNHIDPREAYDQWAEQYDTNQNRTRDLEGLGLREQLAGKLLGRVLEIGCGTGKNTLWLVQHAETVCSVDLSAEMLARAREKLTDPKIRFVQADINQDWHFTEGKRFDLVVFSLVLEHIEDLDAIFRKLNAVLDPGGRVYIGELHPFKQYTGTKARFETDEGTKVVTCFIHHVSEFTNAAKAQGFSILQLAEYFDEPDQQGIPRILTLVCSKQ